MVESFEFITGGICDPQNFPISVPPRDQSPSPTATKSECEHSGLVSVRLNESNHSWIFLSFPILIVQVQSTVYGRSYGRG